MKSGVFQPLCTYLYCELRGLYNLPKIAYHALVPEFSYGNATALVKRPIHVLNQFCLRILTVEHSFDCLCHSVLKKNSFCWVVRRSYQQQPHVTYHDGVKVSGTFLLGPALCYETVKMAGMVQLELLRLESL